MASHDPVSQRMISAPRESGDSVENAYRLRLGLDDHPSVQTQGLGLRTAMPVPDTTTQNQSREWIE